MLSRCQQYQLTNLVWLLSSHVTAGRGVPSAYSTLLLGQYHNYYDQILPSHMYLNPSDVAEVYGDLVYFSKPNQ
jgi:hypothetical protein